MFENMVSLLPIRLLIDISVNLLKVLLEGIKFIHSILRIPCRSLQGQYVQENYDILIPL